MEITMNLLIFILTLMNSGQGRPGLTAVHVERDIEVFSGLNVMFGDSLKRLGEATM